MALHVLFVTVLAAAAGREPTASQPAGPGRMLRYSQDREYAALVVPSVRWPRLKGDCQASLFRIEEEGRRRRLWSRNLVNERAPQQVFVADDGRHVVTIDEWARGAANHAVAVYGPEGELIGLLRLEDLLERSEYPRVKRDGERVDWTSGARCGFASDDRLFVIRCRWGAVKYIDLARARLLNAKSEAPKEADLPPPRMPQTWHSLDAGPPPEAAEDAGEAGDSAELSGGQSPEDLLSSLPLPDPFDPVDYLAWLNQATAVPAEWNGAPLYDEAAAACVELAAPTNETLSRAMQHPWEDADYPEVAAWLDANAEALALFRAGSLLPVRRPVYQSPEGPLMSVQLPSLKNYRALTRALVADANRKACGGDLMGAFDDLGTALRAGQHLAEGATLIEHLVGLACKQAAYEGLTRLMSFYGHDSPQALTDLEHVLAADPPPPPINRPVVTEMAFGFDLAQRLFTGPPVGEKPTLNREEALELYRASFGVEVAVVLEAVPPLDYDESLGVGMRYYEQVFETLSRAYYQAADVHRRIEVDLEQNPHPVYAILPAMKRAHAVHTCSETMRRGTRLLGAIEAYRQQTGVYPRSLDDLPLERVAPIRLDELSGQDFVYRREGAGFVLYSLGEDGLDQGGTGQSSWREGHDFLIARRR